jgi:hypothetical protein
MRKTRSSSRLKAATSLSVVLLFAFSVWRAPVAKARLTGSQGVASGCSLPVTDIKVTLGEFHSGLRLVSVEWKFDPTQLPTCVTIRSFKVQVALGFPDNSTRDGETTVNGSARSASMKISNAPAAPPSIYRATVTGAVELGYLAKARTGQGSVSAQTTGSGLNLGFGALCMSSGAGFNLSSTLNCNNPFLCAVGCSPESYTSAPNSELKVKAEWNPSGPLPSCVKIIDWSVRIKLTFPDNSVQERSASVPGGANQTSFTIANAPASSASVKVTVTPRPATDLVVSGQKSGSFE